MDLVIVLAFLTFAPLLWTIATLSRNYRQARTTGLPVLISPVNPFNPFWIILRPYINPLLSHLPFNLGYFTQYNFLGWEWRDRNRLHTTHGPIFIIVTPAENQLIVANKEAYEYIFKRINEWPMNPAFNAPLDIFGPNVGTAEGHAWQRQRRITAVAFNERNSALVWEEAIKQANQMLRKWVATTGENGVISIMDDVNLLALHVLAGAGFGLSYDFDSPLTAVTPGHNMSYRDALRTLVGNIFITLTISSVKIPPFLLPPGMKRVLHAIEDFRRYTTDMVKSERAAYERGEGPANANLLSSIIRASVEADQNKISQAGKSSRGSLNEEEISGNLFAYNVAGQDTTASTISYIIALLACFPEWQVWLRMELQEVLGKGDIRASKYQDIYPQLKRCQAIMYETLRLYPPLAGVPRYTGSSCSYLPRENRTHIIPPHTSVWGNVAAIQSDKRYWGQDADVWKPSRWIRQSDSGDSGDSDQFVEAFEHSYIPWASGPRVCPGKKFAQVEIVAVIACLMRNHRITPVLNKSETVAEAQERLFRVVSDSDMTLVMRMNHPEKLHVKLESFVEMDLQEAV